MKDGIIPINELPEAEYNERIERWRTVINDEKLPYSRLSQTFGKSEKYFANIFSGRSRLPAYIEQKLFEMFPRHKAWIQTGTEEIVSKEDIVAMIDEGAPLLKEMAEKSEASLQSLKDFLNKHSDFCDLLETLQADFKKNDSFLNDYANPEQVQKFMQNPNSEFFEGTISQLKDMKKSCKTLFANKVMSVTPMEIDELAVNILNTSEELRLNLPYIRGKLEKKRFEAENESEDSKKPTAKSIKSWQKKFDNAEKELKGVRLDISQPNTEATATSLKETREKEWMEVSKMFDDVCRKYENLHKKLLHFYASSS